MAKQTNRQIALLALLNTRSIRAASRESKISERTLYRFLEDESFRREYRKARSRLVENSIASMQAATGEAVETLLRNLNCENLAVETRCAVAILEMSKAGIETCDILERLEILENEHRNKAQKT